MLYPVCRISVISLMRARVTLRLRGWSSAMRPHLMRRAGFWWGFTNHARCSYLAPPGVVGWHVSVAEPGTATRGEGNLTGRGPFARLPHFL
jgi:hypothetical protein